MNLNFPKSSKLLRTRHFQEVYRYGISLQGECISVTLLTKFSSLQPMTRLGLVASRKYGKAHERNRFKRCCREAFRTLRPTLPKGLHIVIRPRRPGLIFTTQAVKEDLLQLLQTQIEVTNYSPSPSCTSTR